MKKIIILFLATFGLAVTSCTSDLQEQVSNEQKTAGNKTKVSFSVDEFITDATTRTSVNTAENYAVTWASGDVIGIFPREGYQEPFEIPADQVGQAKAKFDGGYWALKDGLQYNAYYPFDKANFDSAECKTTIPVTYEGQSQDGTTCNAGAFDYTYSDWGEAVNGSVDFRFHHLGAFFVITLAAPMTARGVSRSHAFKSVTLKASDNIIPVTGTYDLTAAQPAFVPSTYASSITMSLSNCKVEEGQEVVFYMMLPPCDLSETDLTVELNTSNQVGAYKYALNPQVIESGHLYKVTAHQYVDLGLSVKWAACNIGTNYQIDYFSTGSPYRWGETSTGYSEDWSNYKWCKGTNNTLTKYCTNPIYGDVDNKTILDPEDDAAYVNWGSAWRMPTNEEISELINKCTWVKNTLANSQRYVAEGYKVTNNSYSYETLYITKPFWSNELSTANDLRAGGYNLSVITYRYTGVCVRPVHP